MKIVVDRDLPGGHACPHCKKINTSVVVTSVVHWQDEGYPVIVERLHCTACNQGHDTRYQQANELKWAKDKGNWLILPILNVKTGSNQKKR